MKGDSLGRQPWIIEAEIMPRSGVNDPQGEAVMSGLHALGFSGATRVRCGTVIRIETVASSEADAIRQGTEMCERLLANPVIEQYVVSASLATAASR
ncbi:MAG: Phosphoribosylformylglycinamidine synthase, PurS subunit [uncultured Thermomicrobiales bacterium]|uniref:Phosphoribosylformylglycinamidine synthase subunit PurS n=1 Tax=uncultured Thermomicrobiales bacterium TaxID=1645740 RepID=A0A6J4V412_9BACT|nr:MAG: Phosphoribosylformylglycinamidine synthase, PurS subunit [uncultured Thermomicrobiales bacterium]